jgi:diadenosine tetraphosphatase ApaH/serine/threonine PP2A family protein phosphatase
MRYAVLADIHSNFEALTAVLEALASERIDRTLCLGDVMGYGADPTACVERLQACDAVVVGGNHDAACVGKLELEWFNDAAKAALVWTRDQLSFTDLDWLRRLPLVETLEPFTLVHSSLRRPERFEYLVDLAQVVDTLTTCRTLMCLAGHTHLACLVEYDRSRRTVIRVLTRVDELAAVTFRDEAATARYLVNPGSVGQPRDGDPRASFAVIDTETRCLSFHRVRYDVAAAAAKIRRAGLPEFLADRLAVGR